MLRVKCSYELPNKGAQVSLNQVTQEISFSLPLVEKIKSRVSEANQRPCSDQDFSAYVQTAVYCFFHNCNLAQERVVENELKEQS